MACHAMSIESWLTVGLQNRLVTTVGRPPDCSPNSTEDSLDSVVDWLKCLRNTVEEYDIVLNRKSEPESSLDDSVLSLDSCESAELDHYVFKKRFIDECCVDETENGVALNAFDDILKELGNEIYQLEVYQRRALHDGGERSSRVGQSTLNIFDDFLLEVCSCDVRVGDNMEKRSSLRPIAKQRVDLTKVSSLSNISVTSDEVFMNNGTYRKSNCDIGSNFEENLRRDYSRSQENNNQHRKTIDSIFDKGMGTPIPPRRKNRMKPNEVIYNNIMVRQATKPRPISRVEMLASKFNKIASDRDDTNSTDSGNNSPNSNLGEYQTLWSCSSGYGRSVISEGNTKKSGQLKRRGDLSLINSVSSDSSLELPPTYLSLFGSGSKPADVSRARESENAIVKNAGVPSLESAPSCKNGQRLCYGLGGRHDSVSSSNNTESITSDDGPLYVNERFVRAMMVSAIDKGTTEKSDSPKCSDEAKRLTYDFVDNENYAFDDCASVTSDFKYVENVYDKPLCCEDEENIYEEISGDYSSVNYYTPSDISLRTLNSVEVETCESVCTNRSFDGPIYENIEDNSAFIVTSDILAWKDSLLDPYYNEDEEDEWITQEESQLYSKEMRTPFIIPRIKHYIPSRPVNFGHNRLKTSQDDLFFDKSPSDSQGEPVSPSIKKVCEMYEIRNQNENRYSPSKNNERIIVGNKLDIAIEKGFVKASSESPKFIRLQRVGGSNEMLTQKLLNSTPIKPGSGEHLVDVRGDHQTSVSRNGKAKSLMGQASLGQWSPVSIQRVLPRVYDPNMHALLEGFVNRTKLTENGKKVRKNWVQNYLIMTQTSLAFYKDLRTYQLAKAAIHAGTPPSPTSPNKPEFVLSLHGAVVSRCTSQHTSRYAHAFVVTTCQKDQVIIQNDSAAVASHWYEEVLKTINKLPSDYVCPNNNNLGGESPKDEHHKVTPTATRKNGQKHKLHFTKGGEGSNEDVSDLSAEQTNVRAKLRRFFARRPTMDSLVRKGIYKDEPVFGRLLEQVLPDSGQLRVPDFVVRCVRAIEATEENMTTDGLYRASGNLSQVQKIRLEVDQNNMSILDNEVDVHVLTGALKLFFRELKEPLIPCKLFHKALNASSNPQRDSRVKEFREMISSLPESNRQTLKYLLEHLLRVTTHKDMNRMHIPNIAIVFGPTLLWAPIESAHNMAMDCLQQNQVIETLLTDFDLIFSDGNARKKIV